MEPNMDLDFGRERPKQPPEWVSGSGGAGGAGGAGGTRWGWHAKQAN